MLNLEKIKKFAPLLIVVLVAIGVLYKLQDSAWSDEEESEEELSFVLAEEESEEEVEASTSEVIVDIKGEVNSPGVYEVAVNERIQTVIELAGGFTKKADERQINLAQKVQDEMVIYVPAEGEVEELSLPPITAQAGISNDENNDLIHINTATETELMELQGIGPSKAQAIINYRDEHGLFQQVEDLLEVSGIGEKTLENIRDQIAVP